MKKLLFLLLLFCPALTVQVNAQDTIAVSTVYKEGGRNEVYYVNKEGNRIGKYLRYTRYGKVYTEGQYNNGTPVGTWNYYSADTAGKLVQTLNFDQHKETFVDSVNVNSLVCGPRYFGGNTAKQEYIQLRIKTDFTEQERAMLKGKSIMAVFEVDSKTFTTYAITIQNNTLPKNVLDKMTKIIAEMPAWLGPVCDKGDQPVWRQSVVFVF
jgi:hypothetical protein